VKNKAIQLEMLLRSYMYKMCMCTATYFDFIFVLRLLIAMFFTSEDACTVCVICAILILLTYLLNRERKRADTIGTVLVPWAGHLQC